MSTANDESTDLNAANHVSAPLLMMPAKQGIDASVNNAL